MNHHLLRILVIGLTFSGAAYPQQVISYFAELPAADTSWSKAVQLPGFDSSLGTLTQVKLTFTGDVRQTLYAENQSGDCAAFDLTTGAMLAVQVACGKSLFAMGPALFRQSGKLAAFDGSLDFAGASGVRFSRESSLDGTYRDTHLENYLNRPSVDFRVFALSGSILGANCNFTAGSATTMSGCLKVDYSYTAIPEPATCAALLGVAVLGVVTLRRRWQGVGPT